MNDRTEGLFPSELRQRERNVGVRFKLQAVRAGCLLILVNHQWTRVAHAVVAQLPYAAIAVRGAGEWAASDHQQIAAALQEAVDLAPCVFRERGTVGEHQELRGG